MREMKKTSIPWVSEIPAEWDEFPLHVLFEERKNKNTQGLEINLLSLSYGNIVRKSIESNEGLLPENFNGYNIIEEGDIVLRLTDLQNDHRSLRTGLVREHGMITSAYITLKPKRILNSEYCHYLLHAYDIMKVFYTMGEGVRQNLGYSELSYMHLPFPNIKEQEAIVSFLDTKCASIDEAISRQKEAIEKLEEYRKNYITTALTGIADNKLRLKYIAEFINGDRSSNYPSGDDIVDSGIMFVTTDNIHGIELDIKRDKNKYITREKYNALRGAKIQLNDIIYCLRGSVGACALNKTIDEGTVASSLVVIRPHDCIIPEYLNYYLHSNFVKEQNDNYMNGTCAANLSADNLKQYVIALPNKEKQKEIIHDLDNVSAKVSEAISKHQQIIEKLEEYKKALIYNAVTGKIDCRN